MVFLGETQGDIGRLHFGGLWDVKYSVVLKLFSLAKRRSSD